MIRTGMCWRTGRASLRAKQDGLLRLVTLSLLVACGKDAVVAPTDAPAGMGISGTISSDQTWSGDVSITGATTIATGVKVMVVAGTHVTAAPTATLSILGELDIAGTSGAHVVLIPASVTWVDSTCQGC
jgi:hypothetical protein